MRKKLRMVYRYHIYLGQKRWSDTLQENHHLYNSELEFIKQISEYHCCVLEQLNLTIVPISVEHLAIKSVYIDVCMSHYIIPDNRFTTDGKKNPCFYQYTLQNDFVYKLPNLHTRYLVSNISAELSICIYSLHTTIHFCHIFVQYINATLLVKASYHLTQHLVSENSLKQALRKRKRAVAPIVLNGLFPPSLH